MVLLITPFNLKVEYLKKKKQIFLNIEMVNRIFDRNVKKKTGIKCNQKSLLQIPSFYLWLYHHKNPIEVETQLLFLFFFG